MRNREKINYLIMMGVVFGAAGIISTIFTRQIVVIILSAALFIVCCLIGIYHNQEVV